MTTTKIQYAAAATITCTIASKTSGQGERSAAIDNSSNLYDDAIVAVTVTPGTLGTNPYVAVFMYCSGDDGTTYETGGSTDAAYNTLTGEEHLLGVMIPSASNTAFTGVFSIFAAVGYMPRNWGIIIWQNACGTLSATEGNHIKKYQGVTYTNA
jgi:hypothetical protein